MRTPTVTPADFRADGRIRPDVSAALLAKGWKYCSGCQRVRRVQPYFFVWPSHPCGYSPNCTKCQPRKTRATFNRRRGEHEIRMRAYSRRYRAAKKAEQAA